MDAFAFIVFLLIAVLLGAAMLKGLDRFSPLPKRDPIHTWESDEPLPDLFHRIVTERLGNVPGLKLEWEGPGKHGRHVLHVPRADDDGFDVWVECESYALFPRAGEWRGGSWDAISPIGDVVESVYRWLVSVLSPEAKLTVHYGKGRAVAWQLSFHTTYGSHEDWGETVRPRPGSFTTREFRNHHLPAPDVP